MKTGFISHCVLVLTLAVFLAGCYPKPVEADIVGIWVELADIGDPCGSFEFFDNGRFSAKNVSSDYVITEGHSPERIDIRGNWELDTSSNDPFAVHEINLVIDPIEQFPLGLQRVLYIAVGGDVIYRGVDEKILFKKGITCE